MLKKSEKCAAPFIFNLMCAEKPIINGGSIKLCDDIKMIFDDDMLAASVEEIEITDGRLTRDWNRKYLYRIRLIEKEMTETNDINVRFFKI
jgi:hypothetical protein